MPVANWTRQVARQAGRPPDRITSYWRTTVPKNTNKTVVYPICEIDFVPWAAQCMSQSGKSAKTEPCRQDFQTALGSETGVNTTDSLNWTHSSWPETKMQSITFTIKFSANIHRMSVGPFSSQKPSSRQNSTNTKDLLEYKLKTQCQI